MSTNPGATIRPVASRVSAASPSRSASSPMRLRTSTIRPSFTPMSARNRSAPVPSTTVPPVISRSYIGAPQTRSVASNTHDMSDFIKSSVQDGGAKLASAPTELLEDHEVDAVGVDLERHRQMLPTEVAAEAVDQPRGRSHGPDGVRVRLDVGG